MATVISGFEISRKSPQHLYIKQNAGICKVKYFSIDKTMQTIKFQIRGKDKPRQFFLGDVSSLHIDECGKKKLSLKISFISGLEVELCEDKVNNRESLMDLASCIDDYLDRI